MAQQSRPPRFPKNSLSAAAFATAGTLGLHIVTGTLLGGAIGYALDRWLDASPWFLLFFLLIGAGAGYKNILEDARKLKETDENGATQKDAPQQTKTK